MLNTYDDICLSVVKSVNSQTINESLSYLAQNDNMLIPPTDYMPQIWERKWYNNDSIAGYQKGDVVWKWTMTEDQFLSTHIQLIRMYASQNDRLRSYFSETLSTYNDIKDNIVERLKYVNVISGYSEYINETVNGAPTVHRHNIFPSLFDYCYDYDNAPNGYRPHIENESWHIIQVFVSIVDDNKSELSDDSCWKNAVIKSNIELSSYLSAQIEQVFKKHVEDYHFGGLTQLSDYDDVLVARNLSNFNIDEIYSTPIVRDHTQYINNQGLDFVVKLGKTSSYSHLSGKSDKRCIYRWFREWNSGRLEHGGIIEIPSAIASTTSYLSNYSIEVPFNWIDNKISAPAYNYPELSDSIYGNRFDNLYYAEDIEEAYDATHNLGQSHRYSVLLTPAVVLPSDIDNVGKYHGFDVLSSQAYPTHANADHNKTYINFEIHKVKNDSFSIARSNTDDMLSAPCPRYIQYYVSGYKAKK